MAARRAPEPGNTRIVSWNVNGLRACARKGYLRWLAKSGAEVVGIQEVRAREADLEPALLHPDGWHTSFRAAERAGYSGVGIYSRRRPTRIETQLALRVPGRERPGSPALRSASPRCAPQRLAFRVPGRERPGSPALRSASPRCAPQRLTTARFDIEGRLQLARFGKLWIANVYFPKGSGNQRDNSRVPYKLDFYRALFDRLEPLRRRGRVLVMGDFNTAHQEIDLARPRENRETSGFLPEERAELSRWLDAGWVDTLRHFEAGPGQYSWWSQRSGARARNVGWRIDYVLASAAAMRFVRGAFLWPKVTGSDHCPIGVEVDSAIFD